MRRLLTCAGTNVMHTHDIYLLFFAAIYWHRSERYCGSGGWWRTAGVDVARGDVVNYASPSGLYYGAGWWYPATFCFDPNGFVERYNVYELRFSYQCSMDMIY